MMIVMVLVVDISLCLLLFSFQSQFSPFLSQHKVSAATDDIATSLCVNRMAK
jgi:hypothetical protein